MQWQDQAIVLGVKRHGESSVIVETMTRERGRHLGMVRSGRSRAMQPVLQAGNQVDLTWRARLDEHLGEFRVEPVRLRAASLMESALSVYGVQAMAGLLRLLPEREAHTPLYETFDIILDHLTEEGAGELVVRFELAILDCLGFGLDLETCAATGTQEDLAFVSPKSGRAVCRDAGAPWANKMLVLPRFLTSRDGSSISQPDLRDAFAMTSYFLHRHVYEPRGISEVSARESFIEAILRSAPASVSAA